MMPNPQLARPMGLLVALGALSTGHAIAQAAPKPKPVDVFQFLPQPVVAKKLPAAFG